MLDQQNSSTTPSVSTDIINHHLSGLPPQVQSAIKQLQRDSEVLRHLCVADPGADRETMRHVARAIMSHVLKVDFTEQPEYANVGDFLMYFYDRLGDTYAYCAERFPTDH